VLRLAHRPRQRRLVGVRLNAIEQHPQLGEGVVDESVEARVDRQV
jgi:hypothetical protein